MRMKNTRAAFTTVLAILAVGVAAAPASATITNAQRSSTASYALQKCLGYQGCSGVYTDQLIIFDHGTSATFNHYRFHTAYVGWKCYIISVYQNGSVFGGNLYSCDASGYPA